MKLDVRKWIIENRNILILVFLSSILFFFKLGSFSLYDAAETTYGEFIKQMRLTGDWMTFHYNAQIIFDKPPFYYWLATMATYIFGFNEFAIRFWAALSGVLTVVTTYFLGKHFYNEKTGFYAGLIVMTAFQFMVQSRIAEIDILLTLLINFALLSFWLGYKTEQKLWYLGIYPAMALGIITKGIIGAAVPGLAIFLFLLFRQEFDRLKEMKIIPGLILFFTIATPWYLIEWLKHGDQFKDFIMGFLFMARFKGVVAGHPGPWYYYIFAIILGFAPWSHYLPYALSKTWKDKNNQANLLSLCFIIPVFIVFSVAKTKLPSYMLPIYPILAIMVGRLWVDFLGDRGMRIANWLLSVVVALLIIGFGILATQNYSNQYPELLPNLYLLAGILVIGSLTSIVAFSMKKYQLSFYALPTMTFLIALVLTTLTLPAVEKYKGTKELAMEVAGKIEQNQIIAAYDTGNRPGVVFYNSKPVEFLTDEDQVKSFVREKQGFCFVSKDIYKKLGGKFNVIENQGELVVIY